MITDEDGAVIERMSFDAWGKRRESGLGFVPGGPPADGWVPILDPSGPAGDWPTTTRGYTGI